MLVGSFAGLILLGTLLLASPAASAAAQPVAPLDALFTATSAVCVTGLGVVDTGTRFSLFGQWVVLGLIQAGGLGIMTFALFFTLLLGKRISFRDRLVVQDTLHHSPGKDLRRLIRYVLLFTFLLEAAGAALLFLRWQPQFGVSRGLYLSVFHAVSAFCNAGFSLFPDSLMRFRADAWTNLVVCALVIVGGLGFLVNMELRDRLRFRARGERAPALSLHTKLVLSVTGTLLLVGFAGVLLLEWNNLLAGLPLGERLLAAVFQSVTPRTAGFNTLDYGKATAGTLFFTILLMFVGGSPGSTAGGIKTTSLGLLVALARARWAGRGRAALFHRSVPHAAADRALWVTLVSWLISSGALFALLVSEQGSRAYAAAEPPFLALMFESVSAFGTVGLSTGLTPSLTPAGKLIVILLMFLGRLGPLTVALAAGGRSEHGRFRYAEETVMVG